MVNKKQKRESGRKHNKFYNPEKGEYNEQYWDDWNDYRDGFRNIEKDSTQKQPKHLIKKDWVKKKITKLNKIRTKRKQSPRNNQ